MENENNTGKMLGALLLGAAIGGALGILFAPDKGSETRRKISAKGEDLTDAMKNSLNTLLEEAKEEVELIKNKGKEMMDMEINLSEKA
jgi:gas vesicle protein